MPPSNKRNLVAKKRLDKFYYLAKERGYRSRAAFKLVQLDQKYDFLSSATGVLDLCAAPGSWMQVARQIMPKDAVCIGIDRAPIKPIPKCIALQEDITTQKCRAAVKRELKQHGAGSSINVVLHDGAPNVGTAWLQDAFGQNELTLLALKLAVEVLAPGGWFVTKTFRSADYQSLMFVFSQLFAKVEATKPQASRSESAEIFVVCKGFKNVKIDPKFLDPKHVFQMLDDDVSSSQPNVLQRKKGKKAPAEGYHVPGQLLHTEARVADFVQSAAPVKMLGDVNRLVWDYSEECEWYREQKATKPEILLACDDLRVLGKTDLRKLLAWRKKMVALAGKSKGGAAGEAGGEEEEEGSEAEEAREEAEISELQRMADQRAKGAKRRAAEGKVKFKERLALKMEHPGDRLDMQEELELFSLARVAGDGSIEALTEGAAPDVVIDEADDGDREGRAAPAAAGASGEEEEEEEEEGTSYTARLDAELDAMHNEYRERNKRRAAHLVAEAEEGPQSKKAQRQARMDAIRRADVDPAELARELAAREHRQAMNASDEEDDVGEFGDGAGDSDSGSDEGEEGDEDLDRDGGGGGKRGRNSLLVEAPSSARERRAEADGRTSRWFENPLFAGAGEEEDDEEEVAQMAAAARARRAAKKGRQEGPEVKGEEEPMEKEVMEQEPEEEEGGVEEGSGAATVATAATTAPPAAGASRASKRRRRGKAVAEREPTAEEAEDARRAASAAAAVARQFDGRERGGNDHGVPDAGVFEDVLPSGAAAKHVGGRFAEYDSEDEEDETFAESSRAAIERQAEAMVLGQMLLRPDKRRKLEDDGCV
jgi:AdoMet-dependent rRNA methyltransferase SPB1